jgi:hypothetical protein
MNVLETLQKIAATTQRLDTALAEIERERVERQRLESAIISRVERLEAQFGEIRERLVRLEASREADRSQMAAELARFKTEAERAALQLTHLLREVRGHQSLPSGVETNLESPLEGKDS